MAQIVNLTPHDVVVVDGDGKTIRTFPTSGGVARMASAEQHRVTTICDNVPVHEAQRFTDVIWPENLPDHVEGVIVSVTIDGTGQFCAGKSLAFKVYGPDTSPAAAVRDQSGRIVGTKRLVMYR